MTITKDEARKELEAMPARKAELEKILAEPDVDPREWIGKLCVFGSETREVDILRGYKPNCEFPYRVTNDGWSMCRPATPADLEGKIYQPKKKSRYDWVKILKKYPNIKYIVSDYSSYQFGFSGTKPVPADSGWNGGGAGYCALVGNGNREPCPDWRDSLEEKPEGV